MKYESIEQLKSEISELIGDVNTEVNYISRNCYTISNSGKVYKYCFAKIWKTDFKKGKTAMFELCEKGVDWEVLYEQQINDSDKHSISLLNEVLTQLEIMYLKSLPYNNYRAYPLLKDITHLFADLISIEKSNNGFELTTSNRKLNVKFDISEIDINRYSNLSITSKGIKDNKKIIYNVEPLSVQKIVSMLNILYEAHTFQLGSSNPVLFLHGLLYGGLD